MIKECENCKTAFKAKRQVQKYCGKPCQTAGQRVREVRTCLREACSVEFEAGPAEVKVYCSSSCAAKVNNVSVPKRKEEGSCRYCSAAIPKQLKYCARHKYYWEQSPGVHVDSKVIPKNRRVSPEAALVLRPSGSSRVNTYTLRRCLIEIGREYKCASCGLLPEWRGKPLLLEVSHTNGNGIDNRPENLEFLCPNCHRQEVDTNKKFSARPLGVYPNEC